MAFTTPTTPGDGNPLTESYLQTQVADNMNETAVAKVTTANDIVRATGNQALSRVASGAVGGNVANWKHVPKTADESLNTSASLQDDNELLLAIGANEIWLIEATILVHSTSSTPDFLFGFSAPTSPDLAFADYVVYNGSIFEGGPVGTGGSQVVGISANTVAILKIQFYIDNGANAGNFVFRWAQNTSNAANTTVKAGSYLACLKVA